MAAPTWRAQKRALARTAHRPWPLANRRWVMGQTWTDLLFAHWPVDERALRAVVPSQIPIDTYDGSAWLGITPFRVTGARARWSPPLPYLSRFAEVNVRTYATFTGRPGIYFMSLDATRAAAVFAARRAYRLPYFRADIAIESTPSRIRYRGRRVSRDGPRAELELAYAPAGPASKAREGSLEYFLTERYSLYTLDERGRVLGADIHHPPWPLRPAEVTFERNTMASPFGIDLALQPPVAHLAERQDVLVWPLGPVDS